MVPSRRFREKAAHSPRSPLHPLVVSCLAAAVCFAHPALAQPDPSGIDFVTIGAPGNPAYAGPDNNNAVTGRGSVPYEYRLGRTEVTTGQWLEFYNAFYGRVPFLTAPVIWGGADRGPGQSPRFTLSTAPGAADFPVAGPSWRTAAMFCNWLHNDKRTDIEAVMNGAYDARTFGYNGQIFTDQAAHNPDARYWIPTLDEWIKGSYYDPNYGGQGIGGWWWRSVNGSDTPLVYGPPGQGQANADFNLPGDGQFRIPLGAYPQTASPWGLLDVAGATSEHIETLWNVDGVLYRPFMGSHWTTTNGSGDFIYRVGSDFPSLPSTHIGFRVAAAVPAPSAWLVAVVTGAWCLRRRRSVDHAPRRRRRSVLLVTTGIAAGIAGPALAQPDPSGIDFVTVGSPGNPAYSGPDVNNSVTGRGSVPYEYRIGRTEVTTAQWMEFYSAFYGRSPYISLPARWGAYETGNPAQPFALSNLPNSGMFAVSGVTWRTGALFCNWLHNDKRTDLSAIMNGAYDASTFGYDGQSRFTDQQAHNPDARYWIPTIDEWIKSVYFDPNHGGQGVPGWWYAAPNGSNTTLIYAPPEAGGQANANFDLPLNGAFRIPLMAYPNVQSPWGVMDAAGGTREMLESILTVDGVHYRRIIGSYWTSFSSSSDRIFQNGAEFPSTPSPFYGIRIAAAIPAAGVPLVLGCCTTMALGLPRRRRSS